MASIALRQEVARGASRQASLVRLALVVILAYGAFGKEILYNPFRDGALVDPYAAVLTWVRIAAGLGTLAVAQLIQRFRSAGFGAILVYAGVAFCTAAWSLDPGQTARSALLLACFVLPLVAVAPGLGQRAGLVLLLHVLALVVMASAALALLVPSIGQHAATDMLQAVHAGKWRGLFIHKNGLGAYAAYAAVLLFAFSHLAGGPRLYWLVAKCAAVACLVMADSATAIVGAFAMLATWLHLRGASKRRLPITILHLVLLVPALLVAGSLVSLVLDLTGRDATLTGRVQIWDIAIDAWVDRPWFGYGYGTANITVLKDRLMADLFSAAVDAHSSYLEILLDSGIVGLAVLGTAILQSAWLCLRRAHAPDSASAVPATALLMLLVGACVMGAAEVSPFRIGGSTGFITYFALILARVMPAPTERRRR